MRRARTLLPLVGRSWRWGCKRHAGPVPRQHPHPSPPRKGEGIRFEHCQTPVTPLRRRARLRHSICMSKPIVRFAPSPTGHIHIGNTRVALLNALYARREGGTFILRFDDTDLARSKKEYADSIEADLEWLGIPPDVIVRQSDRFELYDAAAEQAEGGRAALSLLRDARGAGIPPQAPARPRPAADLRPGGPQAHRRGAQGAREGRAQAPLALPPRPDERRPGKTSCAVIATWTAARFPIRCWCARTGPISTRCRPWWTISSST